MHLPSWLNTLFGASPEVVPTDTSFNLNKLAHSELVDNVLSDKPLEIAAEENKKCPECDRPNQFGELCSSCTEAEEVHAAQEPKVSLVAELEKNAGAYEVGDSETQTAQKGHESQVKAASDYALAEMLTEMHLQGQGVQERWSEDFPKTLASVQKNRSRAEKEMLKSIPSPTVIDRIKFLSEAMDNKFEPTKSENLYGELFDGKGKQTWEKSKDSWKDEPLTEKEQYEAQMPQEAGPGREADDHRGHQAPRSLTAAEVSPGDIQMVPQDKFLVHYNKIEGGEKYFKWFSTEDTAKHYMESLKQTEFASSAKLKDYSKQFIDKPQETVQKEAVLAKKADIASPWAVVKKDDKEVIARITPEEVIKKSKELETKEVKKSASQDNNSTFLVNQHLLKVEAASKFSLTAAEDYELAQSMEGLEPHEQELWQKYYKLAFQWAMADPLSRKLGKSLTRRAAMMALLRVIRTYNPTHASGAQLSSYLFRAVHNELLTGFAQNRSLREKDPEKFVNIDQPISEGDRMYEAETLQDIIEDVNTKLPVQQLEESEQADMAKEVVRVAQEELKGRQKEIFDLLLQGYNITEIAGLLKFTIPNIVRYRKQLVEQLESILEQVQKTWARPGVPKHKELPTEEVKQKAPDSQETSSTPGTQEVKASYQELVDVQLSLGK